MKQSIIIKIFVFSVFVNLYCFCLFAQTSNLRFRHLTVDNGLSNGEVTSILQDKKGFIWIGTNSGLNRYDGYTTEVYYNNTGGNKSAYFNRISGLCLANNNSLWISTEAGLTLFDPSVMAFQKIQIANKADEALLSEPILKLLVVRDKIYTVSAKKINVYEVGKNNVLTRVPFNVSSLTWPIFDIKKDNKNRVWVTHAGGISLFGRGNTGRSMVLAPSLGIATALHTDDNGDLYISMEQGLYKLGADAIQNLYKQSVVPLKLDISILQQIAVYTFAIRNIPNSYSLQRDAEGNFWLSSSSGLKKIIPNSGNIVSFNPIEYVKSTISDNLVNTLFIDRSACLWVGTFDGGVNIADLNQKPFQLLQRTPNSVNTLSSNHVRALLEDEKGNLWIGTGNGGLNYYDIDRNQYTKFQPSNSGLESGNIRSLSEDKLGRLWIGTETSISVRNRDGSIVNLRPGMSNNRTTANYTAVATDALNQVWAGSWNNGLSRINYKSNNDYTIEHFSAKGAVKGLLSDRVAFIYADSNKSELLVGTDLGLNHIFLNPDGTINKITSYNGSGDNTLSSTFVRQVVRQGDSVIWVGTFGGGLNKINLSENGRYTIKHINDNSSKVLRDIECMLMDDNGNLWLAGKVLAKYNPQKNEFIYFDVNDGLQGNSFLRGVAYKGGSGKLYFTGTNGITYFTPTIIESNKIQPRVTFTNLFINGIPAGSTEFKHNFSQSISYTNDLRLNESQNNFSVQFSSMHFANPERCRFRYKLEGYDIDWRYTDASNRFASYSNLDFGNYKLKVEASNNDGLWSAEAEELNIFILAPWWKSTTAKGVYVLLLLGITYAIWRNRKSWFELKRKLHYKELEEKKQEEIHKMKLQFFTNISHEFRTPLTLILGPTEKLLHQENNKGDQHNYLRLIYSNARRLLGLINELMDFRQAETDNFQLKVMDGNLGKFVDSIAQEFNELASNRSMVYNIRVTEDLPNIYFDPNIVEKITVNLVSNAFKYTEINGSIEIEILDSLAHFKPKFANHIHIKSQESVNTFIWIRVADTGIGIAANSIENIFDRYFRINNQGREKHLGTGVGLALVKSLVELHRGELHVYSERYKGTEFLVGLPLARNIYNQSDISNDKRRPIDIESLHYTIDWFESDLKDPQPFSTNVAKPQKSANGIKRILVVEDNEEMRRFLVDSLSGEHEVIEAADGLEGYSKASEYLPDLIVSDLMMPGLDGNELCKKIREDVNTSHTPIVLITANASVETHIESAESGADIYFPKPFSIRLLQATINNLFDSRARLKEKYNKDVFAETREIANNQKDKDFLDEFIAIIEENMESEDLDVEMICRKIGMSRTKLYGKIKGITGQPIGEFTRLLRLKKAAKIMVAEDIPILEVMDRVGIQSQSYFIKQFKKEFGKTPSAFIADFEKKSTQDNPLTAE